MSPCESLATRVSSATQFESPSCLLRDIRVILSLMLQENVSAALIADFRLVQAEAASYAGSDFMRASERRLWCFKCERHSHPDNFSQAMRGAPENKRSCLKHHSASATTTPVRSATLSSPREVTPGRKLALCSPKECTPTRNVALSDMTEERLERCRKFGLSLW